MRNEDSITTAEKQAAILFPADLRDWFAGQVVSGVLLMVSTKHLAAQMAGDKEAVEKLNKVFVDSAIADEAYTLANAMLEAREK